MEPHHSRWRSSPIAVTGANVAASLHVPISNRSSTKRDRARVAIPLRGVATKNLRRMVKAANQTCAGFSSSFPPIIPQARCPRLLNGSARQMERQNSRPTESQETAEFCNTIHPKADMEVTVRHFSFGPLDARSGKGGAPSRVNKQRGVTEPRGCYRVVALRRLSDADRWCVE